LIIVTFKIMKLKKNELAYILTCLKVHNRNRDFIMPHITELNKSLRKKIKKEIVSIC